MQVFPTPTVVSQRLHNSRLNFFKTFLSVKKRRKKKERKKEKDYTIHQKLNPKNMDNCHSAKTICCIIACCVIWLKPEGVTAVINSTTIKGALPLPLPLPFNLVVQALHRRYT